MNAACTLELHMGADLSLTMTWAWIDIFWWGVWNPLDGGMCFDTTKYLKLYIIQITDELLETTYIYTFMEKL